MPLLLLLSACGPAATGDLNLVAVDHTGWAPEVATAEVERIFLEPCDAQEDLWQIDVGYEVDLRFPEPFAVAEGEYCAVGVEFAEAPVDGALHLSGTTAGGVTLSIDLDPGLATRERSIRYDQLTEGVLALDLALLLQAPSLADLEDLGDPATVTPETAEGEDLAEAVGPALIWYDSPLEAESVYVDLWPDFNFSFHAEIIGCNAKKQGGYVADPDDATDSGTDTAGGDDTSGGDTSGGGGGGCDGGNGGDCSVYDGADCNLQTTDCNSPGCDTSGCDGSGCTSSGCDLSCATIGFAPMWTFLFAVIGLRRRRWDRPDQARSITSSTMPTDASSGA